MLNLTKSELCGRKAFLDDGWKTLEREQAEAVKCKEGGSAVLRPSHFC